MYWLFGILVCLDAHLPRLGAVSYTHLTLPTMDGDSDRDQHRNTGLSPQGSNEEQKEEELEKGNQDREGCVHPLIQGN